MTRLFVPLSVVFAVATAAQAQTYSRSNTYIDPYGNTITTKAEDPSSVAGRIARQSVNGGSPPGGVPIYNGAVPIHSTPNLNNPVGTNRPIPPFPPHGDDRDRGNWHNGGRGRNPKHGNNGGYGYYPNYGYNAGYGYGYPVPAPYPYPYPPQAYFVPGQTIPFKNSGLGWAPGPSITSIPQVITTPGVPFYGYPVGPGFGYPVPVPSYGYPVPTYGYPIPGFGYGYSSNTTITNGGFSFNRGGISVRAGSTTIQNF